MKTPKTKPQRPKINPEYSRWQKVLAHWRRLATGRQRPGESIHADDCAFCLYHLKTPFGRLRLGCGACPVKLKTKRNYCGGTPWENVNAALGCYGKDSRQFRDAARQQYRFLYFLNVPRTKKQTP